MQRSEKFKENLTIVLIIISAPILSIFLSVFIVRAYQVDGPSMLTTLHDKDRLIINKVPRTWSKITGHDYIPNRYDIIVFEHKGAFSGSNGATSKQIIKRVIGLPGERIVVQNGVVKVFNNQNPNGYLVDNFGPEAQVIPISEGNIDATIKSGEVFVMGDNRTNSLDSRTLGTIPSKEIVGKLVIRIYPFKDWKSF